MPLCTVKVPALILMAKGPLLPVRIHLPTVVAKLRNANPAILGTALIDTGATKTCISTKAAKGLSLKPVGTIYVGGVGGAKEHSLFRVSFEFIQNLQTPGEEGAQQTVQPVIGVTDLEVVEADIDGQGLMMLIGRDVLAYSALTYDGPTGAWTLEIPRTRPPGQLLQNEIRPIDPDLSINVSRRSVSRDSKKTKTARRTSKKARKKNRGK